MKTRPRCDRFVAREHLQCALFLCLIACDTVLIVALLYIYSICARALSLVHNMGSLAHMTVFTTTHAHERNKKRWNQCDINRIDGRARVYWSRSRSLFAWVLYRRQLCELHPDQLHKYHPNAHRTMNTHPAMSRYKFELGLDVFHFFFILFEPNTVRDALRNEEKTEWKTKSTPTEQSAQITEWGMHWNIEPN